jgi:hypothetical protein
MIKANPDVGVPAAEALFNVLLEAAGDNAGPEAVARLRAEHPALAVDDLAHGFLEGNGPMLDDEIMRVATRVLVALDPARFEIARFPSAEDAFNGYQQELATQRRNQGFAAREGGADSFWQRQIAKQEDAIRRARASWRAAAERAMTAGESLVRPDQVQREALATRDGEETLGASGPPLRACCGQGDSSDRCGV